MRKMMTRLLAALIAISLTAAVLVGCNGRSENIPENTPEDIPTDIELASGKTVLTLAIGSFHADDLYDVVARFNVSNDEYYVQVLDYSKYNPGNDPWAGDLRLKTEMMSGSMPDILDMSLLWYSQFAAMGFLENLYPYIDADPDFSRGDFFESVLRVSEIDGGLYQVCPSFYINTIVGHPAVLGAEPGWSMEEFIATIEAHPEADMPLGVRFDKETFLIAVLGFDLDNYVDWEAGTVNFDTPEFIQLLEFSNTLPAELTMADYNNAFEYADSLIPTGRQIMSFSFISGIFDIAREEALFGGDIVLKGFPSEREVGHSLQIDYSYAMTTGSEHKDGVWQFLRMFLDAEYQANYGRIPSNKNVFDAQIDRELQINRKLRDYVETLKTDYDLYEDDDLYEDEEILEAADQLRAVIDTASGSVGFIGDRDLRNIVFDEASRFFSGEITAQEAANIIQNRASILMSERH